MDGNLKYIYIFSRLKLDTNIHGFGSVHIVTYANICSDGHGAETTVSVKPLIILKPRKTRKPRSRLTPHYFQLAPSRD
jgi:hypothetical protein